MNPETLNPISQDVYGTVSMLMKGVALIVGFASVLFVLLAVAFAACEFVAGAGQHAKRPATASPLAQDRMGRLAGLDCNRDHHGSEPSPFSYL